MGDTYAMHEALIETERLELHHIPVNGLISLFDERDDRLALAARDITNPYKVLVDDQGPLPWRAPQVKLNPTSNKWFLRFIVVKSTREIIGSTSFHGVPDENGMMEIGIGLDEKFWGNGYAQEALLGMWRWVVNEPLVRSLRYTVTPTNIASVSIIKKFGFPYIGQQMDEIDGPEDIYEISVEAFREKWGAHE